MKKLLLFAGLCLCMAPAFGQSQADAFIKEAQGYLAQKEYKQALLSLQDAINDINNLVAQQIAESLPAEINGLKAEGTGEVNNAAMGMLGGGMQITKNYKNPAKKENDVEVMIMANSPMMATMNMYIGNPSMLGSEYKSVRLGTRRAILKSEMNDFYDTAGGSKQIRITEIQVPLTQTLITLNLRGFATEADELAFANKLDIEKLRTALGE
jgi:hypothetical protein